MDTFQDRTEQEEAWFAAQFRKIAEEPGDTAAKIEALENELRARFRAIREEFFPHKP